MKKKERDRVIAKIASGACRIVVGTHALIQEDVAFRNLSFVIIDEQHKFGVDQRLKLIGRGVDGVVDLLVMTATPIPRTLSLTLYGDLDLSVIDELPPGRKPVVTRWYSQGKVDALYGFIRTEIEKGEKAYFIYPLVEESEKVDLKNAVAMFELFRDSVFKGLGVGLIHGKMDNREKDAAMAGFKSGELKILVATTVVEVGVDVPDATIIVVENAERFGLAQLHQLRGRIGRSDRQSYCLLVTGFALGEEAKKRMDIMRTVGDGFKLAEEDLKLRGPGEFLGTRQSGMPDLYPADIVRDGILLETCRRLAADLLEKRIVLTADEKARLWEAYKREVRQKYDYIRSG
jgi:ATP-dependent DNA helicase RecG